MLRSIAALLTLMILLAIASRSGIAQDLAATPRPAATPAGEPASGRDVLLRATIDFSASGPVAMRLLRIVLEPGGSSPLHAHPGLELGLVESGTLAVRVEGRAVLLRADAAAEAGEPVPTGVEVSLGADDRIAYAPGTLMTFRNPGPDRVTLLAATILPTGPAAPPGAVYPGGLPTAEDAAGVRSFILGDGMAEPPQQLSAVVLERLDLAAGDVVPAFAGPVLTVIEEGELTGSVVQGDVVLPGAAATASPAAEADLSLVAGESIYFPDGMAETPPLGGAGRVLLLRLGIVPLDVPTATAPATPVATEPATAPGVVPINARVVVVVPEARLRAEPSLAGPLVAGLPQGTVLVVTGPPIPGSEYVWYPVQAAADPALAGFIAADLIAPAP